MKHTLLNIYNRVRLPLMVAGMLLSTSSVALADNAGFFTNGACNTYMYRHTGSSGQDIWLGGDNGYNGTGASPYDMGEVTQLWLNQWWAKVWKNNNAGDVCGVKMYYRLGDSGTSYVLNGDHFGGKDVYENNQTKQTWGKWVNLSINLISKLCNNVPGSYEIQYWFEANTNQSGTSNCSTPKYLSNGGSSTNYRVSFTYVGIKDLSASTLKFKQQNTSKSITFTSVGTQSTPGYTITGSGYSSFSVTSISTSGVEVEYTGTASTIETATLTITPTKGSPVKIELQGSDGNRPVPLIAGADVLGNSVALNGYLQYTGCDASITEYGFYYMQDDTKEAIPTTSNTQLLATQCPTALMQGSDFSGRLSGISYPHWYAYRSYAKGSDGTVYLSQETGRFQVTSECPYPQGDTIYVTVDNTRATDKCNLVFNSLDDALSTSDGVLSIADYRTITDDVVTLTKNIVLEVVESEDHYEGTSTTSESGIVVSGGDVNAYCIKLKNINNISSPSKVLVIRGVGRESKEEVINKPVLEHLVIRNCKNIVVEKVRIEGRDAAYGSVHDNAVDIDNGSKDWLSQSVGAVANANIKFKHCYIYSKGFTCIHASAYSGLFFENNDIKADFADESSDNALAWGSSIKFIHCKDVVMLRNSMRGSHTTTFWIQGCNTMLFMNNVCWNDNKQSVNTAVVRLVSQSNTTETVTNIGFYYNTMYLAYNADKNDDRYVDFFRIGTKYTNSKLSSGLLDGNTSYYKHANIAFQYNNCYSYDEVSGAHTHCVIGRNPADGDNPPFLVEDESDWCSSVCYNNFWSKYDEAQVPTPEVSAFAIGCDNKFINVADLMCHTAAEDPDGLIIVGAGLNWGNQVPADVSGKGANNMFNDRLHPSNGGDAVRRGLATNGWTLGAYQQTNPGDFDESKAVGTIVWNGGATGAVADWDNRNNWYKLNGERVTCLDYLSDTLRVVIPAPNSTSYPIKVKGGVTNYPEIPSSFSRLNTEKVNRHSNEGYAKTIYIEDGGAIMYANRLKSGASRYYTQASTHVVGERSVWQLVGTVIKPFDETGTRLVQSGDFFCDGEPQVYMREAMIDGEIASYWQKTFPELTKSLEPTKVFAMRIPNEYGPKKWPAAWYYEDDASKAASAPTEKVLFPFTGYLYNEENLTTYSDLTPGTETLLCNTYPANIDAQTLQGKSWGNVQLYNVSNYSFGPWEEGDVICPQQGFLFIPAVGITEFTMTNDCYVNGSTKPSYRSANMSEPYFTVEVSNLFKAGASKVKVTYDALKDDQYNVVTDGIKIFNNADYTVPELYIMEYERNLSSLNTPDLTRAIPLGLRISRQTTVQFRLGKQRDFNQILLVDTAEDKTYDLLDGESCTLALPVGTYEGRFFLNLGVDDSQGDKDIPTVIDNSDVDEYSIEVYGDGKNVVISSNKNVVLRKAYITDTVGRTVEYDLMNSHFNVLALNGGAGVYIVRAIGDKMNRTEKIILK